MTDNAEQSSVVVVAICEQAKIVFRPNQLYRFIVMPGCAECKNLVDCYDRESEIPFYHPDANVAVCPALAAMRKAAEDAAKGLEPAAWIPPHGLRELKKGYACSVNAFCSSKYTQPLYDQSAIAILAAKDAEIAALKVDADRWSLVKSGNDSTHLRFGIWVRPVTAEWHAEDTYPNKDDATIIIDAAHAEQVVP